MTNARKARRKRTSGTKPRVESPTDAAKRTSEGMVRGERDGVRDGRSAAVREVHDRPRTDGSQRRRTNDRTNGEGDLRTVRGNRGSAGEAVDTNRSGSSSRRPRAPARQGLAAAAAEKFVDRKGRALEQGGAVKFHSYRGTVMPAVVEAARNAGTMVLVRIGKDPFPTYVDHRQLECVGRKRPSKERTMAKAKTATPVTRELRQKARDLSIPNWEVMDRDELLAAVSEQDSEEAPDYEEPDSEDEESEDENEKEPTVATSTTSRKRKASAKAPPSKRAPAKKATTAKKTAAKTTGRAAPRPPSQPEGPNPFRPGSNLHAITEELMKGGKRSTLVKRLLPKLEYKPRTKDARTFDAEVETDRRLKIVGYLLRQQYGFEYEHGGHGGPERGPDAYIKVTPPS